MSARWATRACERPSQVEHPYLAAVVLLVLVWAMWAAMAPADRAPDDGLPRAVYVVDTPTAQAERLP
jgi:hypothetical protein